MEFEKNAPTTAQDIALADAARVTLQPMHGDIKPDSITSTAIATDATRESFEFETESTAPAAMSSSKLTDHPHHTMAIIIALISMLTFGGMMSAFFLLSR